MSIKNNSLADKCKAPENNRLTQLGMFLLQSAFGGIKMIGITLLAIVGGMVVVGIFLGVPSAAITAFESGQYIAGGALSFLTLVIYGAGFNELR